MLATDRRRGRRILLGPRTRKSDLDATGDHSPQQIPRGYRQATRVRRLISLSLDPLPKVIWMQLGVRNAAAAARAEAKGVQVVMNRCPKIEYGRLSGEIGWHGVNSRILSARKTIAGSGFQRLTIGPR